MPVVDFQSMSTTVADSFIPCLSSAIFSTHADRTPHAWRPVYSMAFGRITDATRATHVGAWTGTATYLRD